MDEHPLTAAATPEQVLAERPLLLEAVKEFLQGAPRYPGGIVLASLGRSGGPAIWGDGSYRVPQLWQEAARLASRTATPDRAAAREHARKRDQYGQQMVADHNTAVAALTAFAADPQLNPGGRQHPHIAITDKPRRPAPSFR